MEQRTGLSGYERRIMNTETIDKIAEVIDGLCEKLGTTAQYLIPELAKAYIGSEIYNVIIWGIATLVCGILAVVFYKKHTDDDYDSAYMILSITFFGIAVVGFIILAICGEDLVAWIASPTAKTLKIIMDKVK